MSRHISRSRAISQSKESEDLSLELVRVFRGLGNLQIFQAESFLTNQPFSRLNRLV